MSIPVRNRREIHESADDVMSQQLALYKTPSTLRELVVAPFVVQIVAPRRPLFSRRDVFGDFIEPGKDNKRYRFFPQNCIIQFPYGHTFKDADPETSWNATQTLGGRLTYENYEPGAVTGAFGAKKIASLKQAGRFPYGVNATRLGGRGSSAAAQFPIALANPPLGDTAGGAIPNPNPPYELGLSTNSNIPHYAAMFHPVNSDYDPPVPFPNKGAWDNPCFRFDGTVAEGSSAASFQTTTPAADVIKDNAFYPIPDLIGTKFKVDLREQQAKLNDIRGVNDDKIMWRINLDYVQINADGRTLSSARLINAGDRKMEKYINGPERYNEEWQVADSQIRELTGDLTGFGHSVCWEPRKVIAQPISIGIEEINTANDPVSFIVNANEGASLDKSSGSVVKFGRFPYSEMNLNIGKFLKEGVGDPSLIDNEVGVPGYYDINGEYFGSSSKININPTNGRNYGSLGPSAPVFYNSQVDSMILKFSISLVALW